MKSKLFFIIFSLFALVANGQTKVGTINSEFIVGLMPETKKVITMLNDYAAKLDSSYQVKLKEYNDKVTAFQNLDPNLSDNFKKIKIDEITQLEDDLQKSQQNGNSLINLKRDELMKPLYKILSDAIVEISKAEGFTQVLTTSGNEFVYLDDTYDLTEKVISKLGIKIPPPSK